MAALVGLIGLIITRGRRSVRSGRLRRRMRYETWWSAHLYMYLALALAFPHQIANGQSFVGHPLARLFWAVLWAVTAGVVLVFRVVVPIWRSLYHGLRVVGVQEEAAGVVSVICRGRHLDRLDIEGGQFFHWRFLARGHWWSAHPYSISALPRSGLIRFTVKDLGDHSQALSRLPIGTRVAIEGPYGAFHPALGRAEPGTRSPSGRGRAWGSRPMRALLRAPRRRSLDVTVLMRATTDGQGSCSKARFEVAHEPAQPAFTTDRLLTGIPIRKYRAGPRAAPRRNWFPTSPSATCTSAARNLCPSN